MALLRLPLLRGREGDGYGNGRYLPSPHKEHIPSAPQPGCAECRVGTGVGGNLLPNVGGQGAVGPRPDVLQRQRRRAFPELRNFKKYFCLSCLSSFWLHK